MRAILKWLSFRGSTGLDSSLRADDPGVCWFSDHYWGGGRGRTFCCCCLCLFFSKLKVASREPLKVSFLEFKGQGKTLLTGA